MRCDVSSVTKVPRPGLLPAQFAGQAEESAVLLPGNVKFQLPIFAGNDQKPGALPGQGFLDRVERPDRTAQLGVGEARGVGRAEAAGVDQHDLARDRLEGGTEML